ncbi:hypothetical protein [Vibrio hepatarius]|uniref:hypothetical protein n=1 Tax=Vibrio hepatarius TaxID=171383 RepID=UPI00148C3A15|nr:hypothetical protein [Vibrio hepatarius]NOI15835.1 hypothetical protein [Vibrio hepatarius]
MKEKKSREEYLEEYRSQRTKSRVDSIEAILEDIKSERVGFRNMTHLSEYIAKRLSVIEGCNVASSTIRRNDNYRSLMYEYFYEIAPSKLPSSKDISIEASIKIRQLNVQLTEAKNKVAKLTTELQAANDLLSKRLTLEYVESAKSSAGRREKVCSSNEESDEDLFKIIHYFLREELVAEFNLDDGYIYDAAEEEVIMTKKDFPKFFKWLATKV